MMQASDEHSDALVDSENTAEDEPVLAKEFSFSHGVQEPLVELGPAFLSKLQKSMLA